MTVTLIDNNVPVVSFAADAVSVAENVTGGMAQVTVQLSASPTTQITIPVSTTNGTATAGTDYTALTQNVVFASGASGADLMQTVNIAITDDTLDELDETFTVSLGMLPSTVSGGGSVTVTITDDDVPAVSFTAGTAGVAESAGTVTATVQLSISSATELTIPVATTNGTATSGTDYTALTQNVVFASGASGADLMQTVSITVTDDGLDELDEMFTVGFGTLPPGVSAGTPATVTVTLTDDDVPTVSFTTATTSVVESTGTAAVTVQLSVSPATELTIPVATTNGTATSGMDYTALTQNVVFAAGTATLMQTVSITVTDDGLDELDETFTVAFGALPPGVAAGTPATVTVTLTDDDVPTVSFTAGTGQRR